ncbi:MAG: DUF4373 domain-containing protein [Alloprevotella sp.]
MARPSKTGLDYFPFDVDFFHDEKILSIAKEFGPKGELCVVKLLCAVYRNGYFILWDDAMRNKMLMDMPCINKGLLEQIVGRLVRWNFFEQGLFNSAKVLTSIGIQKRYFSAIRGRKITKFDKYILVENGGFLQRNGVSYEETGFLCRKPNAYSVDKNQKSGDENGVSYKETGFLTQETEFLTQEIHKEKKKKEKTTDVVKKNPSTSPSIDDEVNEMKNESIWLEQIAMLHHTKVSSMVARLDEFRLQCLADGKQHHESLADAKQHFNAWLRIVLNIKTNENVRKGREVRRPNLKVAPAETEDYTTSF